MARLEITRSSDDAHANASASSADLRSSLLVALFLVVAVFILYIPALQGGFVNYDDPAYITANAHVLQGLSASNLRWALTATVEANWHPLTWMSHMADVEWFGTDPRGHHFVNVVLHACNVVILFFVLLYATGRLWRSALVAALFAVHPLNVECVAWVAERKSLLSMLFLLLAIAAYGWYARKRRWKRYALVLVLFALGLAAKPMIVTLPILLLLWDYWPLGRLAPDSDAETTCSSWFWLIVEKIPLLVLAAASSWITLYAQRSGGALGSTELLPLSWRIENAIYSYAAYIVKGIWPAGLAVFYPHPEGSLALWKVLSAGLLIVVFTVLAWRYRKAHRYLLSGWLWYLAAMLPMIGVVQVGRQAMADRYAYLPFVGLFILGVWGSAGLLEYFKLSSFARGAVAAAVLSVYASMAFLQVSYWHNSYTLFAHALEVTSRNGVAEDNLGDALMEMRRPDLALAHFQAAIEYVPQLSTAHYNLGVLQQQQNHLDIARQEYELALKYSSDATEIAQAHNNLGFLLMGQSDLEAAEKEFSAALRANPNKQNSALGRGMVEYREEKLDAAVADLSHAAQIEPSAAANFWLGRAFEDQGQKQAAEAAYAAALQIAPDMTEARQRLDALRSAR
jgi:tetratricopeptide (TPR) repeat protein